MQDLAHSFRDLLVPVLAVSSAGVFALLVIVILQRLLRNASAWHLAQLRERYRPLLQAAMDGQGPERDAALKVLRRARGGHRTVIAEALLEPLRVVQGSAIDHARELAEELGLLDDWRRRLLRGTWSARSRAALALGLVRDGHAVPALVQVLDDPHDEIRAAAVDALGAIGDVAAVQALLARMGAQSRHQQARLVEALRRIGPAVTASLVSLDADGPGERRMIAEILGLVGGTGARVPLMEWTTDDDPVVRSAAWRSIGMIGMDHRAAYHALRALGDADPRVRAHAAQALGRTGRTDFVPYLLSHLDDEWEVAAQGARALSRLGEEGRAALQSREDSGDGGHGLELARHFLWEQRRA